jgi:hypothetical protein
MHADMGNLLCEILHLIRLVSAIGVLLLLTDSCDTFVGSDIVDSDYCYMLLAGGKLRMKIVDILRLSCITAHSNGESKLQLTIPHIFLAWVQTLVATCNIIPRHHIQCYITARQ